MYNGIGLQTPRGSGTNGHVQRNFAFVRPGKKDSVNYKTEQDIAKLDATLNKPPNQEILDHARKRKIEVKCAEFEEILEKQGYSEAEIQTKVDSYRSKLMGQNKTDLPKDEFGRITVRETHEVAEAQQEKNAKLREAFGISEYFVEGTSFDPDRKAKEDLVKSAALQKELDVQKEKEKTNRRHCLVRTPSNERNDDNNIEEGKSSKSEKKKKKKRNRDGSASPDRKREKKKKSKKHKKESKSKKKKSRKHKDSDSDTSDSESDSPVDSDTDDSNKDSRKKKKSKKDKKKKDSKKKKHHRSSSEDSSSPDRKKSDRKTDRKSNDKKDERRGRSRSRHGKSKERRNDNKDNRKRQQDRHSKSPNRKRSKKSKSVSPKRSIKKTESPKRNRSRTSQSVDRHGDRYNQKRTNNKKSRSTSPSIQSKHIERNSSPSRYQGSRRSRSNESGYKKDKRRERSRSNQKRDRSRSKQKRERSRSNQKRERSRSESRNKSRSRSKRREKSKSEVDKKKRESENKKDRSRSLSREKGNKNAEKKRVANNENLSKDKPEEQSKAETISSTPPNKKPTTHINPFRIGTKDSFNTKDLRRHNPFESPLQEINKSPDKTIVSNSPQDRRKEFLKSPPKEIVEVVDKEKSSVKNSQTSQEKTNPQVKTFLASSSDSSDNESELSYSPAQRNPERYKDILDKAKTEKKQKKVEKSPKNKQRKTTTPSPVNKGRLVTSVKSKRNGSSQSPQSPRKQQISPKKTEEPKKNDFSPRKKNSPTRWESPRRPDSPKRRESPRRRDSAKRKESYDNKRYESSRKRDDSQRSAKSPVDRKKKQFLEGKKPPPQPVVRLQSATDSSDSDSESKYNKNVDKFIEAISKKDDHDLKILEKLKTGLAAKAKEKIKTIEMQSNTTTDVSPLDSSLNKFLANNIISSSSNNGGGNSSLSNNSRGTDIVEHTNSKPSRSGRHRHVDNELTLVVRNSNSASNGQKSPKSLQQQQQQHQQQHNLKSDHLSRVDNFSDNGSFLKQNKSHLLNHHGNNHHGNHYHRNTITRTFTNNRFQVKSKYFLQNLPSLPHQQAALINQQQQQLQQQQQHHHHHHNKPNPNLLNSNLLIPQHPIIPPFNPNQQMLTSAQYNLITNNNLNKSKLVIKPFKITTDHSQPSTLAAALSSSELVDKIVEKVSKATVEAERRSRSRSIKRSNDGRKSSRSRSRSYSSSRSSSGSSRSRRSRSSVSSRSSRSSRSSTSASSRRSRSVSRTPRSRSGTRSPSIPRRRGSPSFLDRRRITSARKRPIPYHRPTPSSMSCSSESPRSHSRSPNPF